MLVVDHIPIHLIVRKCEETGVPEAFIKVSKKQQAIFTSQLNGTACPQSRKHTVLHISWYFIQQINQPLYNKLHKTNQAQYTPYGLAVPSLQVY